MAPKTTTTRTLPPSPESAVGNESNIDPATAKALQDAGIDPSTLQGTHKKLTLAKQASDLAQPFLENLRGSRPGEFSQNLADWQDQMADYYAQTGQAHRYQRGFSDPQTYADTVEVMAFMYENGFSDPGRALDALTAGAVDSGRAGRFHPGVIGGGSKYTINLTNPNEVAQVADKAAFALLGRKATDDEQQKLINSIRSQEVAEGQKGIAVAESEKKAKYQAAVSERDQAVAAAGGSGAPSGGAGGLSNVGGVQVASGIAGDVQNILRQFGVSATSGYRSPDHNKSVGGAENSDHLSGKAVDFSGTAQQMNALYQWAQNNAAAMGLWVEPMSQAKNHVHISFRGAGAGAGASSAPAVGQDVYIPPETAQITRAPSPAAEAYKMYTEPGSPTELEYGAHQAATSVYDALLRGIKGNMGPVSGGGAGSVV